MHQEDINIIILYTPNTGAPKYIRKILKDLKKIVDSNTFSLGDFNTTLLKMDRSSKEIINNDIVALNHAIE